MYFGWKQVGKRMEGFVSKISTTKSHDKNMAFCLLNLAMKIIILLFCFVNISVFAQSKISGKVIDSETKQGIAFVSIIYLNDASLQGGYTDSLGNFNIKVLDLEFQVSCIGYQTLKLKGKELTPNQIIELKPLIYVLNAVEIKPKKLKTKQLGYFKNKIYSKLVMNPKQALLFRKLSNYVVQYIANKTDDNNLFITKLKYNLSNHLKKPSPVNEKGCETSLLRVHLFEVDKNTNKPSKELLTKNIIFNNDCQKDNLIVDVVDENIYMPKNGIFVGLEFIDNKRSVASTNYPFYVVNLVDDKKVINTYVSSHQENWKPIMGGFKFNVQFGIEVAK